MSSFDYLTSLWVFWR